MWTEIITEDVGVTHIGDMQVVIALSDDVQREDVRDVIQYIEERNIRQRAAEQFIEQSRAMRRNMEQKRRAREHMRAAGYDDEEIPL